MSATDTPGRPAAPHVVVVGGGVAGLTAALRLLEQDPPPAVTLLEAGDRLGGKVLTGPFDGLDVDAGPDSVLARVPWGVDLLHDLGLGDELAHPAAGSAYVWRRGRLRRIPDGLVLGVPADLSALARSGVLSPTGMLRAGLDLVLPPTRLHGAAADSVGALVRARFGDEVLESLVDPLLGGINAGAADSLSVRASAPQLVAAARHRSLLLGLRSQRPAPPAEGEAPRPVFATVVGGLGRAVDALAQRIRRAGGTIATGHPVERLTRTGAGWEVATSAPNRRRIGADGVVLASPAPASAELLRPVAPEAAGRLAAVPYASVVLVTVAVDRDDVAHPLDASGLLVPRGEDLLVTACSFGSSKWAHWQRPGRVLLRVSAGRIDDERALELADGPLVDRLCDDLRRLIGLSRRPDEVRITRWERSFPQYLPGHLERVAATEEELGRRAPGVVLAGASLRGVGIPACVRSGEQAAAALAATLRAA